MIAQNTSAETLGFPFVAQAASLFRHRSGQAGETVQLITSRPAKQLSPAQWLDATVGHWTIETGLHARLDASRHDDRCRLRRTNPVWIHGMFNRWANSLLIHWRDRRPNGRHLTTTDFGTHFAADHARRALAAVTALSFPS